MSANMDTVTDFKTANLLAESGWISTLPKQLNYEILSGNGEQQLLKKVDNYALSCGTSKDDVANLH